MRLRELFEASANEVAIIFGRFNPPHKGHRAAWELASQSPAWFVGTNESTVGPKDPLPYEIKVEAMKAIWPEVEGHIMAETSWLTMASKLYKKYPDATLLCLTDEDWVTKTIVQYNGKEGAHGFYNFKDIKQKPTPRLSSATALRDAVTNGDREAFAQAAGVPADTPVAGKPFFDLVAEYLLPYANAPKKVVKKKVAEDSENKSCPLPTQDLELNTKNRNEAIQAKHIQYGPLNADEPGNYWKRIAVFWNTTEKAAQESNCGNCSAFDVSPRMLDCMPGKLEDEDGTFGYCWMHKFKCHSARSCRTWAKGGPITTDKTSLTWDKDNQDVSEVSRATIDRYVAKASDAHGDADFKARMSKNDPNKRSYHVDQKRTAEKRRQGISRALDRMSREGVAEGSLEEYGDTAKGQKILTKVQKRAVDRMIKADDKRDAKSAKKNQDTANRAWDRMTGVEEARQSAQVKLAKAWDQQQAKSAASRERAKELLNPPKKEEPKKTTEGKKPEHNLGTGWMLDKDKQLGQKVAQNKAKSRQEKDTMQKYAGKKV